MTGTWRIDERSGHAGALHASWPEAEASPGKRAVSVCRVTAPALVLGSTQPVGVVDSAQAVRRGVSVARRRSGGGAVLVTPEEPLWVDLWVPATDPLWSDDVSVAFDWVGDTWVAALGQLGLGGVVAHRSGPRASTRWSKLVCFGGIGRGEVVDGRRRKMVGLAQRRTRAGAWFHCACALRWESAPLVDLLDLPTSRAAAVAELDAAVVGAVDLAETRGGRAVDAESLAAALVDCLPGTLA